MTTQTDFSACRDCLCDATRRSARAIMSVYDHALAPHGIRNAQFTILTTLEMRGAASLGELATFLAVDRTTLTRNLALLEAKQWVSSRVAAKDSRSRVLSVTEEGRSVAVSAFPAWRKAQDRVAAAVRGHDLTVLSRLAKLDPLQ
jgi:DNA-binding MarR family transcriptional regulator